MNILDLQKAKESKRKISMVTCYDYWSAKIIAQTHIDCVLVGDTSSMIMHGHPTTITATVEMIAIHVAAVARGLTQQLIIGDMPFLSYRKGKKTAMRAVEKLMHAGAHAIKLEGAKGHTDIIQHIVESGVPVMGHLGMTPQSFHQLGGFRVQGKTSSAADDLYQDALTLQAAGCFALVLECVPAGVAQHIAQNLQIPIIGIGAGNQVDGQVLVLQDLLGFNADFKPKFVKTWLNGFELAKTALQQFDHEVKTGEFPTKEHSYMPKETAR